MKRALVSCVAAGFLVPLCWAVDYWDITVVDEPAGPGSLGVLPSGHPAVAYRGSGCLKYASYDGTNWNREDVDPDGGSPDLAILPSGEPAMAYLRGVPMYAWRDGMGWHKTAVQEPPISADSISLAVLPSGHPAVCYTYTTYWGSHSYLKYAWHDGNQWQYITIGSDLGETASLAVRPTGLAGIAYHGGIIGVGYADEAVSWRYFGIGDGDANTFPSLAFLPSGQPAISYYNFTNQDLKYAWHEGTDPFGDWHYVVVDYVGNVGWGSSLAVLSAGQPAISYCQRYPINAVKFAWFDGATWRTMVVEDLGGSTVDYTSLAALPSGQPAIIYVDAGTLKYAVGFDYPRGDLNCDGAVDFDDINPFVLAMASKNGYEAAYPDCRWLFGDIDGNGSVDFDDINPFVKCLVAGRCP